MKYLNALRTVLSVVLILAVAAPSLASVKTVPGNELISAVNISDYQTLATMLIEGANVDQSTKQGFTPLMAASKIGDRMVIGVLLSHEPDVNLQNNAGATALMIASKYGHEHVVLQLLENGADPTLVNNYGNTAAEFAYAYKNYEIHRILKKAEREFENAS